MLVHISSKGILGNTSLIQTTFLSSRYVYLLFQTSHVIIINQLIFVKISNIPYLTSTHSVVIKLICVLFSYAWILIKPMFGGNFLEKKKFLNTEFFKNVYLNSMGKF